jgi:hypothetical protein
MRHVDGAARGSGRLVGASLARWRLHSLVRGGLSLPASGRLTRLLPDSGVAGGGILLAGLLQRDLLLDGLLLARGLLASPFLTSRLASGPLLIRRVVTSRFVIGRFVIGQLTGGLRGCGLGERGPARDVAT